jgi:hypothetical protein
MDFRLKKCVSNLVKHLLFDLFGKKVKQQMLFFFRHTVVYLHIHSYL